MSIAIRAFFEKVDRAKYISHLDITRVFSRAIARTTIPVWYTEGFNPRIYMTFPLPLSLGYEGYRESFDIKLVEEGFPLEQVATQLNRSLPTGIRILEVALPVSRPDAIALADYRISIETAVPDAVAASLQGFVAQPTITVVKRNKKGERELDIKPLFTLGAVEQQADGLRMMLRLAAGTTLNVSPALFIEAFTEYLSLCELDCKVERMAILDVEGNAWG